MRYTRVIRYMCALVLALSSMPIFADPLPATSLSTDLSVKYLGEIFGTVPGVLYGSGTNLIGGLFHVFNAGIMTVATVWLVYTIFQLVVMSAMFDQPQKNLKNWAIHLRIVMGFALLVPLPSGYNIAQEAMMQVVVAGVKLADSAWTYVLNYMQQGNLIYANPAKSENYLSQLTSSSQVQSQLGDYIGNSGGQPSSASMVYQLYNDEVCMALSNQYVRSDAITGVKHLKKVYGNVRYHPISVPPVFSGKNNSLVANTAAIYFPGYPDTSAAAPVVNAATLNGAPITVNTPNDGCGYIAISPSAISKTSSSANQHSHAKQSVVDAYQAIYQAALDMEPLALAEADSIAAKPSASQSVNQQFAGNVLFSTVADYLRLMQPVATLINSASDSDDADFMSMANNQGWFNAGGFYWDMIRMNDDEATTNQASPVPYTPNIKKLTTQNEQLNNWLGTADERLTGGMWSNAQNQFVQVATGINDNDNNQTSDSGNQTNGQKVGLGILSTFLPIFTQFGTVIRTLAGHSMAHYNPLLICHNVGVAVLGLAADIWLGLLGVLLPLSIVAGFCDSVSPAGLMLKVADSIIVPPMLVLAGMLFVGGAILTFYLPLYPYLVFMFGVIGWLLAVAEAMIAVPLVCFGMTHPEGHDFLGSAQQALMLALGVFLRPVLILVGYIFGMLLVYVCSSYLNLVLGQVFVSAFNQTNSTSVGVGILATAFRSSGIVWTNGLLAGALDYLLCIPIVITLYVMIMVEVTHQCFSAIYQIPNMVLRWIGGPVGNDNPAQQLAAIKGAVSDSAQQTSSAMNKGVEGSFNAKDKAVEEGGGAGATKTSGGSEEGAEAAMLPA